MIRAALVCLMLAAPAWSQAPAPLEPPVPGKGLPGAGPHACIRIAQCVFYDDPFNANCGTRGGPGCRKENGRCAAWREGFAPDCRASRPAGAN